MRRTSYGVAILERTIEGSHSTSTKLRSFDRSAVRCETIGKRQAVEPCLSVLCVQHYISCSLRNIFFEMYARRKEMRWFVEQFWSLSPRELGILKSRNLVEEEVGRYAPQRLARILKSWDIYHFAIDHARPDPSAKERRWSLPKGGCETTDISPYATIRRELYEETGIDSDVVVDSHAPAVIEGYVRSIIYCAHLIDRSLVESIGSIDRRSNRIIPDKTEVARIAFIPVDCLDDYLSEDMVEAVRKLMK